MLNLRGAWTSNALGREGNPSRASVARNMRFSPGLAYSREGTSAVQAVAAKVTGMFNWLTTFNYVIYQEGTTLKRYLQSGPQTLTMKTGLTQRAPSISDLGTRVYLAGYNTSDVGVTQAFVHNGGVDGGGAPNMDLCFRGPLQVTSMTATDGGAGACTKGTHFLGFIFQSRTGFSGKPSPVTSGDVFAPASVTLNAGARTINVAITLNTPSDAGVDSAIYPIITRADNPNEWYFVPDVFAILPASTAAWTQNLSISISDEDLATSATLATDQFSLLTASTGGSGPFNPNFVRAYGRRMTYGVVNKVYVSGINDPQSIAEDRSVVQMQNQRKIFTAFPLGQFLYLLGDKWTGRTADNGDDAATWPQPSTVSDSIGTPCAAGVEWRTAGDYAWVASESGLYVFDGSYPSRPITYFVSDIWNRINWNAAYVVQIADDTIGLRCYVALPLDGATEPNYMLVVDYTNGLTFDSCDISLDDYNPVAFSSVCMVKEYATSRTSLWKGPAAAGNIVHLDTSTHNDEGNAIHAIWKSSYIRQQGEIDSTMIRVGSANLWVRGSGTLKQTWAGLDDSPSVTPADITLSASPGVQYFSKKDLNPVEQFTFLMEVNGVGHYMQISGFRPWTKPGLWVR